VKVLIIKLLTYWKDGVLECTCPTKNKCNRQGLKCEELDFTLNPYADVHECMKHDSHIRVNGRVQQRR